MPITPAPTIQSDFGLCDRESSSVEEMTAGLSIPGMGGILGREPVAMMIFLPSRSSPPTEIVWASLKAASPWKRVIPGCESNVSTPSTSWRTTPSLRSMALTKASAFSSSVRCCSLTSSASWASDLVGMQPMLRQVPPAFRLSTIATCRPCFAA